MSCSDQKTKKSAVMFVYFLYQSDQKTKNEKWNESDNKLPDFIYSNLDDSEVDNCACKVWNLNWTASHSGSGLTGLVKDLLRYGRNTSPDLILWNYRKNPRINLGVDFMDQNILRFKKVHIKNLSCSNIAIFWQNTDFGILQHQITIS